MKLAPTLQSWVMDDGKWSTAMKLASGEAQTRAQAELRALLAVARAAKHIKHNRFVNLNWAPLGRTLARLERVSRKP